MERLLAASKKSLRNAECRIQQVKHNKDTLADLALKVDESEAQLKSSEWELHFIEENVSEQCNILVEIDAALSGYRELVVVFEMDLAIVSAEAKRLNTHHTVDKDSLDRVRTALSSHRTTSQQHVTANSKDCKRLLAEKAAVHAEFSKFLIDMQAMVDRIQMSADSEKLRAGLLDGKRVRLVIAIKSVRYQL